MRRWLKTILCKSAGFQGSDDLLDDRVSAVGLFGLEHGQGGVGEHPVVTVARDQLTLPVRDCLGVQAHGPGARSTGR